MGDVGDAGPNDADVRRGSQLRRSHATKIRRFPQGPVRGLAQSSAG